MSSTCAFAYDPAAARLFYKFGIAILKRYPLDVLLDQDKYADDTSVRYGIVTTARHDHGVMESALVEAKPLIESLAQQLTAKGIKIRIVELNGFGEFIARHTQFVVKYGKRSSEFGVHIAHGSPKDMRYGKDENSGYVHADHMTAVLHGYREGAPQVLVSCLTGSVNGIAQTMSQHMEGVVQAPHISVEVPQITVNFDTEERPSFALTYQEGVNVNRAYQGGQKI